MSFKMRTLLLSYIMMMGSIHCKPAVNNSILGANLMYKNDPQFSSKSQDYYTPEFTNYDDYGDSINPLYMNTEDSFYPDNTEGSTNGNPINNYNDINKNHALPIQNEQYSSPENMWNDFLSPQDEKSIPEYEMPEYPSYDIPQDVDQNVVPIDSNPQYPVDQSFPMPMNEYQDYGVPENIDPNEPTDGIISDYPLKPDYEFQPQYPNYGIPQNIEPNKPFEYPAPQPNYPDYGIPQTIVYNNPCNPCQWYDPCCYRNCIKICDQEPWPTPDPYPPFPTFIPPTTPEPLPPTTPALKTTTPTPEPECQVPGWNTITVGEKSFEIYVSDTYGSKKRLSWFEADSMARDVGGYLAEITSAEETELLNEIKKCYPFGPMPWFWIGGNDLANYTHWVWTRGTSVGPYENWNNPSIRHDPRNKCMMLKFDIDYEGSGNHEDSTDPQPDLSLTNKWYMENCKGVSNPTSFIAEKIEGTLPPPTPRPTIPTRPTIPITTTTPGTTTTTLDPDEPTEQPPL